MENVYKATSQDTAMTEDERIIAVAKEKVQPEIQATVMASDDNDQQGEQKKCQNEAKKSHSYSTDDKGTYKDGDLISNFSLTILYILNKSDCDEPIQETYCMEINFHGEKTHFFLPAEQFSPGNLMPVIRREVGPKAYLLGSEKDLFLAIQMSLAEVDLPRVPISLCTGFTADYRNFLLPGLRITPEKISDDVGPVVDLSGGNLSRHVKFRVLPENDLRLLIQHLIHEFGSLKPPEVMYPLIGHIALSPFSTPIINELGMQKYTLHLKGPSGGGKTFIANATGSFFGNFGDRLTSWSATANSIEAEGYHFRDMVFILDDYKASIISKRDVIRVIQHNADNRGRTRLNSSLQIQKPPHIRGLVVSTGEDFVDNVESVSGRTIVLEVGPEHNQEDGNACRSMQHLYNGLIPRFIHWVISSSTWLPDIKSRVNEKIDALSSSVTGISNGRRMASNWALNYVGFELFCQFAVNVEAIDDDCYSQLMAQYDGIVTTHLANQATILKAMSPVAQFFCVMEQLIATQTIVVEDLTKKTPQAMSIGKLSKDKTRVYIFPDLLMSHLVSHFRRLEQPMPFTKDNLRTALIQDGLLEKQNNRFTKQIRHNGGRVQAWQFDLTEFKKRCLDAEDE